jgi:hypothetical protein
MMPNFIVIGAPRAGTTSLYHYLRQHPQILMSRIKETNYFAYLASQAEPGYETGPTTLWPVKTRAEYEALFQGGEYRAIGEASPLYFFAPGVARQIKTNIPDARLVMILRNPVERAYSAYLKNCREGIETRSFEDRIMWEIQRPEKVVCSEHYYLRAGMYFERIADYLRYFERSRLKIVFQEDLQSDPTGLMGDLFTFLSVDVGFVTDTSVRFNQSLPPLLVKSSGNRRLLKEITRRVREFIPRKVYYSLLNFEYSMNKNLTGYSPLDKKTRLLLLAQYRQDILNLQDFLGRDLSHWLAAE